MTVILTHCCLLCCACPAEVGPGVSSAAVTQHQGGAEGDGGSARSPKQQQRVSSTGVLSAAREEADSRDLALLLAQQQAIMTSVQAARGYSTQLRSAAKSLFSQAPEALGQKW